MGASECVRSAVPIQFCVQSVGLRLVIALLFFSRFKLMKSDKDRLENELSALANLNRFMFNPPAPAVPTQSPTEPLPPPPPSPPPSYTSQTTFLNGKEHRTKRPFTIESLISDDRPSKGIIIFLFFL